MAALLILVVTALTPVALAASPAASPSATAASAPKGTPIPVGVIPDPNQGAASATKNLWNGDVVQVNFEPHDAELDTAKCQVYVERRTAEAQR